MKVNWRVEEWFPDLTQDVRTKLKMFHVELLRFNQSINLISQNTVADADLVHIADSVCAGRILRDYIESDRPLFDFGSGNGCPGVVISIVNPNFSVNLVESDERKALFLSTVVDRLSLTRTSVINQRAEAVKFEGEVQGICRAFGSIREVLNLFDPILSPKSQILHLKGPDCDNEIKECGEYSGNEQGSTWNIKKVGEYRLPLGKGTRNVVLTQKK